MTLTLITHLHKLYKFSASTMFQVYGCNKFHGTIGLVNAYLSLVVTFFHVKVYVSKIALVVKLVKVILGSSFEQTMMGWSPKHYIPSFSKISPLDLEKIFEWFYHIYGHGGHLGHMILIS